jgi:hypothetical protein
MGEGGYVADGTYSTLYSTYLMFLSPSVGADASFWVPVHVEQWHWSFTITGTANGNTHTFVVQNASGPSPAAGTVLQEPTWTQNSADGNWGP